jgi:hypothetical protein
MTRLGAYWAKKDLRAVCTGFICVRFSVRDGATAQQLPLLDRVRDHAIKAKEAVGRWCHRGRDNGRKKRDCRRTLTPRDENTTFALKTSAHRHLTRLTASFDSTFVVIN